MDPLKELSISDGRKIVLELPARSIIILTSIKSNHEDPAP